MATLSRKMKVKSTSSSSKGAKTTDMDEGDDNNGDDDDDDNNGGDDEVETPYRDPPDGYIRIRPSAFKNIPSTIFFEYPPELGIKRMDISCLEPMGPSKKLGYNCYWERNCIKNAFLRAGFAKTDKHWTINWTKHQNQSQLRELNCLQKVNHYPSSWCIGRKDRLSKTLNAMKRIHGEAFNFHPETFVLPADRDALHRVIKTTEAAASASSASSSTVLANSLWIIKPPASSCGKGIKVVSATQILAMPPRKKILVQKYLAKPYLIDGKKFDLRIYVLVSGVDPLRVYIHDEGLTRISTVNYSLKNTKNRFAHLTNYSINKKSEHFKAASIGGEEDDDDDDDNNGGDNDNGGDDGDGNDTNYAKAGGNVVGDNNTSQPPPAVPGVGSHSGETEGFKWSMSAFRRWLAQKEGQAVMESTMDRIFDLCVKTVIAGEAVITPETQSACNYRSNCFELFGMDVFLDSKLRPHLIEVNVSPSLMGSSPLDKKIKGTVMADVMHIVGIYPHDPKQLQKYNNAAAGEDGAAAAGNPFAFASLSKMMSKQENYRKFPTGASIDFAVLGGQTKTQMLLAAESGSSSGAADDSAWLTLLMVEDEISRADSTRFHCVHPTKRNASLYNGLYRTGRFSDHLLSRWVEQGGSKGSLKQYIPSKYLLDDDGTGNNTDNNRPKRGKSAAVKRVASSSSSSASSSPTVAVTIGVGNPVPVLAPPAVGDNAIKGSHRLVVAVSSTATTSASGSFRRPVPGIQSHPQQQQQQQPQPQPQQQQRPFPPPLNVARFAAAASSSAAASAAATSLSARSARPRSGRNSAQQQPVEDSSSSAIGRSRPHTQHESSSGSLRRAHSSGPLFNTRNVNGNGNRSGNGQQGNQQEEEIERGGRGGRGEYSVLYNGYPSTTTTDAAPPEIHVVYNGAAAVRQQANAARSAQRQQQEQQKVLLAQQRAERAETEAIKQWSEGIVESSYAIPPKQRSQRAGGVRSTGGKKNEQQQQQSQQQQQMERLDLRRPASRQQLEEQQQNQLHHHHHQQQQQQPTNFTAPAVESKDFLHSVNQPAVESKDFLHSVNQLHSELRERSSRRSIPGTVTTTTTGAAARDEEMELYRMIQSTAGTMELAMFQEKQEGWSMRTTSAGASRRPIAGSSSSSSEEDYGTAAATAGGGGGDYSPQQQPPPTYAAGHNNNDRSNNNTSSYTNNNNNNNNNNSHTSSYHTQEREQQPKSNGHGARSSSNGASGGGGHLTTTITTIERDRERDSRESSSSYRRPTTYTTVGGASATSALGSSRSTKR